MTVIKEICLLTVVCCLAVFTHPTEAVETQQCGRPVVRPMVSPLLRIGSGIESSKTSWPWQALLYKEDKRTGQSAYTCGASIIDKRWILTAYHCVLPSTDVDLGYKVYLGVHNGDELPEPVWVDKVIPGKDDYDIALLHLAKDLEFSDTIQPVCLPDKDPAAGTTCVVTGWGMTGDMGMPDKLWQAEVLIVDNEECRNLWDPLNHYVMCAEGEGSYGWSCGGDPGGPLVCQRDDGSWQVNGVVDYSAFCKDHDLRKPSVYARVTSHLDWIKETMKHQRGDGAASSGSLMTMIDDDARWLVTICCYIFFMR